jgi:XRE family transcriptional regulator, regulator of sulfur utilization
MRISSRDVVVAITAASLACGATALAQNRSARLGPAVWDWDALPAKPTDVGAIRDLVRQPTATLDELEMHITTLKPGLSSHAPHTHPNEELVIIREGIVETLSGGTWRRLGPGSVIFNASNSPHALRNVGTTPATYHVINWTTPATPKQ